MKRLERLKFYLMYGCLAALGLLGLGMCVFSPKAARESYTENRMLAAFPQLTLASLRDGSFMDGVEDWLSDAAPERDGIISTTERAVELLGVGQASAEQEETTLEAQLAAEAGAETEPQAEESGKEAALAGDSPAGDASQADMEPTGDEAGTVEETEDSGDEGEDATGVPKARFYFIRADGTEHNVYHFSSSNMANAVKLFDTIRAMLPEDGLVYFGQAPFPAVARQLTAESNNYVGWSSNVEDILEEYCADGFYGLRVTEALQDHLLAGEKLYFTTDHHWTPLGACYTAEYLLHSEGYPFLSYQSYTFKTYHNFVGSGGNENPSLKPESIDILEPILPSRSFVVKAGGKETEIPFMRTDLHTYMAYLGGTYGPWRRNETGVDANRKCLIVSDSYANALIPFLAPYYSEIHSINLGTDYITPATAGYSFNEYIAENGIDDVIFIPSTSSSINGSQLLTTIWKYID